jgi:hypothetical protein
MRQSDWRPLGGVDPRALGEARLQAHYAAQWLARTARAYIPAKPDDSHTNLGWNDALDGFMTHAWADGARLGMSISTLNLAVVDASDRARTSLPLHGRTDREARAWLGAQVTAASLDPAALDAALPYEMPPHAIADGFAYDATTLSEALKELAAWFANASGSLNRVKADHAAKGLTVSPVRCWPHHFDIATLISLDGGDPEHARSVNAGLSPGDGSYDEPYFYVSPWPYPDVGKLPPLPSVGHWHTQGFLAAVAPASRIVAAADQRQAADEFLQAAVTAAITALA